MANTQGNGSSFGPDFYLNSNEQDLLLNALNSNVVPTTTAASSTQPNGRPGSYSAGKAQGANPQRSMSGESPTYASPTQQTPLSGTFANSGIDGSPYPDGELDESNLDWDFNEDLIGGLPGDSGAGDIEGEHGEKRKSPEDGDDQDGNGKRHEHEDKTSKKPGRKPLTSEPTSKRKAQNRAAQRAFRERKEKHLKDLETKVEDLERASEATNSENGSLRAQVERLQAEVKEYRKRLSLNSGTYNRGSPTIFGPSHPVSTKRDLDIVNNFQFDFPRFGGVDAQPKIRSSSAGDQSFGPLFMPNGDVTTTPFPMYNNAGPAQTQSNPNLSAGAEDYSSFFSPATSSSSVRGQSTNGDGKSTKPSASRTMSQTSGANPGSRQSSLPNSSVPNLLRRNGSEATVASPASHTSNLGFASSTATTPESYVDSPKQNKANEGSLNGGVEGLNASTGPPNDLAATTFGSLAGTPGFNLPDFDWLAKQNGGAFDPVLFGDYRDPQENIMNSDATTGFFNEAFALPDFGAAAAAGTPATGPAERPLPPAVPAKKGLMQEIEETQAGKEPEVELSDKDKTREHFLTCNLLWDRVQRSDKVQNGEADMDDLCSQLKSKAKCSGSGPVISSADVDKILGPSPDPANPQGVWAMFK